jgi:hypothetical protein
MSSPEETISLLNEMEKDSRAIINAVYTIMWHFKGLSREEAYTMSHKERMEIIKIIEASLPKNPKKWDV